MRVVVSPKYSAEEGLHPADAADLNSERNSSSGDLRCHCCLLGLLPTPCLSQELHVVNVVVEHALFPQMIHSIDPVGVVWNDVVVAVVVVDVVDYCCCCCCSTDWGD